MSMGDIQDFVHKWEECGIWDQQTDYMAVHCNKERAERKCEGVNLLVSLRSYPFLWSQTLSTNQIKSSPFVYNITEKPTLRAKRGNQYSRQNGYKPVKLALI